MKRSLIKNKEIYYPKLSYKITGLLFKIHNKLERFKSERQYCDEFENLLRKNKVEFLREKELTKSFSDIIIKGNIPDFLIEKRLIVDLKAKKFITKEDYFQMVRYLEVANLLLGFIVNFRSTYLKPKRILNPKFNSSHSNANS